MTDKQDTAPKQIEAMSPAETPAVIATDPQEEYRQFYEKERPRAEQQVRSQLEALRRKLGHDGLAGSET